MSSNQGVRVNRAAQQLRWCFASSSRGQHVHTAILAAPGVSQTRCRHTQQQRPGGFADTNHTLVTQNVWHRQVPQQRPSSHLADEVVSPVVALQRKKVAAAKEAGIGSAWAAGGGAAVPARCIA